MNKKTILISAPVSSRSGYGSRARDLVRSLLKNDRYEIIVMDTLWGSCPPTALDPINDKDIIDKVLKEPTLPKQPEIFIQLTVPSEFQRHGSQLNIGITAGIETTACSLEWIEGINRMDVVFTSSVHSRDVLSKTQFNVNVPNQPPRTVVATKPVEILIEGVDLLTYGTPEVKAISFLDNIKEQFCFLSVGHWLPGDTGHDRKDIGMLIKTFLTTFKNVKIKPALVLKSGTTFSEIDKADLLNKINDIRKQVGGTDLPNVYLLFGELTDHEMNSLYDHEKIKAHITFTHGEGFGRPLAEASLSVKPLIVPNWSGLLDFTPYAVKLSGQLQQIHPSAAWDKVLIPESGWFYVNYSYASAVMKDVVLNYKKYTDGAKRQAYFVKQNFSMEKMNEQFKQLLSKYDANVPIIPMMPQLVPINLPTLQTT